MKRQKGVFEAEKLREKGSAHPIVDIDLWSGHQELSAFKIAVLAGKPQRILERSRGDE